MQPSDITADYVRSILEYSPVTGLFAWRYRCDVGRPWNARYVGALAGCKSKNGYLLISIKRTHYYAHRLAWLYMTGEWPPQQIDHIDGVRENNKWDNLRSATSSENACNKPKMPKNSSGYKGVGFHKSTGKWRAYICAPGHRHLHLGMFLTAETAYNAYCEAAKTLHGNFARTR